MQVNETLLKVIAIGLIPVFLIISFVVPKTDFTVILQGIVMVIGVAVCLVGMSMQKKETKDHDDLLALPPKKS